MAQYKTVQCDKCFHEADETKTNWGYLYRYDDGQKDGMGFALTCVPTASTCSTSSFQPSRNGPSGEVMSDTDAQIAAYRKRDQELVKQMRDMSLLQKRLWDEVNYPKALWHWRLEKMRKFWDGAING